MHPVLFYLGNYPLRSFGLLMAVGVLLGSYLAYRRSAELFGDKVFDFCFWAVLAGLLGSRLWEVVFTWQDYRANPLSILAIWQGGLSIQGGILGGVIAGYVWTRKEKIPFWTFADLVVPGLLLGQALGRVGCFMAGDDFGVPTAAWVGVAYAPGSPAFDVYGTTRLVPAELMEGIWDIVIIGIILVFERLPIKRFSGANFPIYLGLYSVGRLILENYRDYGLTIGGWRTAQLAALVGILISLLITVVRWKKYRANVDRYRGNGL